MNTAERLAGYYNFDQTVLDNVQEVAERHAAFSSQYEVFEDAGMLEQELVHDTHGEPFSTIEFRPQGDYDERAAMVIHLAMGQPLDENNLFQISTVAAANPDMRIIAAGNPSGRKYPGGALTKEQRKSAASGDFRPVVEPLVRYIEDRGIETVEHLGYSYGSDRAVASSAFESADVTKLITIEPVTVVKRSLVKLLKDFSSSNGALKDYVEASGPHFKASRKKSLGLGEFAAALVKPSNLAIARGLTGNHFRRELTDAITTHPNIKTTVAWGTESELADNEALSEMTHDLSGWFGSHRVQSMPLEGGKHALANDVYLQAAIVAQARK